MTKKKLFKVQYIWRERTMAAEYAESRYIIAASIMDAMRIAGELEANIHDAETITATHIGPVFDTDVTHA